MTDKTERTEELKQRIKREVDAFTADLLGEYILQADDEDAEESAPNLVEAYASSLSMAAYLRRHLESAVTAAGLAIADKLPPFCDECGAAADGLCGETHPDRRATEDGVMRSYHQAEAVVALRSRLHLERATLGARIADLQLMAAQRDATEGSLRHDLHIAQRRSYGFHTEGMTQVQIATAAERITELHVEIEGWKTLNRTLLDQLLELAALAAPPPSPEQLARIEEIRANLRAAEERAKNQAPAPTCEKSKEV